MLFLNNLIDLSTIDSGFRMTKLMINVCELYFNFLNPWYLRTIILNKVQDPIFVIFKRNNFFFIVQNTILHIYKRKKLKD